MTKEEISTLNEALRGASPQEVLAQVLQKFGDQIALSSSLGSEEQVLTDMLMKINPIVRIFTLATGRLFPETYDLIDRTSRKYKTTIEVFFPEHKKVEKMVNEKGINLFYESVENGKFCCHLRKIGRASCRERV